jgi:hypothetical protein
VFVPVRRLSRFLAALALVVGAQAAMAGAAFAYSPQLETTATPSGPGVSPLGGSGKQQRPGTGGGSSPRGYDISYPQCGAPYPSNPLFAIVGVNGGKVFGANSCLASQITWGGGASAELYANTGNPGPALSSFWPKGQATPRFCDTNNPDTADCAYDYGWNAAQHSYQTAVSSYASLGLTASPSATAWWLDVETTNSWRSDTTLNVAELQGEADYLRSVGVTRLGFYSTTAQWTTITGGSKVFSPAPSWGAGSSSEKAARSLCQNTVTSFTGGRLAMVQYPISGFDANVRC